MQRKDFPATTNNAEYNEDGMNQKTTFIYQYSAKNHKEIEEIRRKYLPREESKLEELKRLDHEVSISGIIESLCSGICGMLILGLGMCLSMQVIGNGWAVIALGILLGIIGMGGMIIAYPIYRKVFNKTKQKLAPRILELIAELRKTSN